MRYNHFNKSISIRLVIIILLSMAISYLLFVEQNYAISLLPAFLLLVALINIIRYFNKINQWVAFFLLGIENEDTTLKVPSKSGNRAIDDIYFGINRLNELFQQTKVAISTQEQYFRSIINQSATGLFSINKNGRVININPAAIKLTGLQDHHHVNVLAAIDAALPEFLMHPFKNKQSQSAIFENKYGQKLLFKLSEIISMEDKIRLVAVSDITKELDNGEVDAWIKLARTLSHEIMNNIAPITTLSQVISSYFTKENRTIEISDLEQKTITNTIRGLKVIEERSVGLMSFVDNYRKFTKLPAPKYAEVDLCQIIENNLMAASTYCGFEKIKLIKIMPVSCMVSTDQKLVAQVIINLLKNACEALQSVNIEDPTLTIKLLQTEEAVRLEISNNGPCIPPEIKEQIFIPFYTTKDEGSGVGLSLSKQIMLKMGGDVILSTSNEQLTQFVIIVGY
ncbi:MAG: GHKL domain-containing protein [Bacteroidetes bacterium]|nr:GHKL domain-containing protein [Bacteroidota bacterium]